MSSKILSRAEILAADDVKRVEVAVPEWGGSVFVTTLTAGQRDAYETMLYKRMQEAGTDKTGKTKDAIMNTARASLVVISCVDAAGAPLFTADDIDLLCKRACSALDRIVAATKKLNELGDAAIEELVKN